MLQIALITTVPDISEVMMPLIKALEADVVLVEHIAELGSQEVDAILWHPPVTVSDALAAQLLAFNVPIVILVPDAQEIRFGTPGPHPDPVQSPFSYFLRFPFDPEEMTIVIKNLIDLNRKRRSGDEEAIQKSS